MSTYDIPKDVMDAGEATVLFFIYLMEKGNDSRFAEMLALRKPPRILTDDVALSGMKTISRMYDEQPDLTERLCRIAEAKGYRPKPTDVYMPSIAACEGDVAAFVNHGQGRGHIKKVLESRGQSGDGMVKVSKREPESDPYEKPIHQLNPKIVNRIRKQRLKQNPELGQMNTRDVQQQIIQDHGAT